MHIVASRGLVTAAVLLISSGALAFGQDLATAGSAPGLPPESKFRKEYLVSPGDQLDIVVRRVPEATRSVVVRSDGQITLPLANDVAVAGLTTREIDAKLKGLLSQRLRDPEVTVIAAQSHPATVYVGGEVNAPGAVPLRNAATAVQAIALAGGLKRSASVKNIVIIRLGDDGKLETIPLDLKDHSQRGGYEALAVTRLTGDDIIFVPENGRSEVSRFIDDFINRPLQGVNSILGTYVNFRLVQIISKQVQ